VQRSLQRSGEKLRHGQVNRRPRSRHETAADENRACHPVPACLRLHHPGRGFWHLIGKGLTGFCVPRTRRFCISQHACHTSPASRSRLSGKKLLTVSRDHAPTLVSLHIFL